MTQPPYPEQHQANPGQQQPAVGYQGTPVEMHKEARTMAMICHLLALSAFTGIPFANILGPLILWLIKKDEMPFVNDQGKEAINFNISFTIYMIVSALTILLLVGIVLFPAVVIAWVVLTIIAAIKANEGQFYRYPLTIRFLS